MQRKVRETSRQVIAMLLAAAMCVTLLPSTVLAAGEETDEQSYELTEEMTAETDAASEKGAAEADTEAQAETQAEAEKQSEPKVLSESEKPEETVPEEEPEEDDTAGGDDSVIRLYAGASYENDGIKPLSTDEPGGHEDDLEKDATITVTIEVKDENGNWVAYDPNTTYSRDTEFRFTMVYDTNESKIEQGEKYQLPDGLVITSETSGHIYDSNGNYAGEYYIQQEGDHWYVYFEYDTEWEHDPENEGHDVEGTFDFTATLDEEYINNHDDWTLVFPGAGDFTIKLEDGYVTAYKDGSFDSGTGKITYSIVITVVGEDMKTVTLTDVLENDGLSYVEDGAGQLAITVPDATALVVTYKVHVNGQAGETVKVSNNATLIWEGGYEDDSVVDFEIEESHAGITTQSGELRINKIDSGNITESLAGAEFELYVVGDAAAVEENHGEGTYVTTETTNESGEASFTGLDKDKLYYYVETKAPDGYSVNTTERYYFILSSDTSSEAYQALIQACEDAGLEVSISTWPYEGGYILNVPNSETEDDTVDIEGSKTWVGDTETGRPESITINLFADGDPALDESGNAITATVTEADGWTWSFTDLPKYAEGGHEIVYTITEDPVEGYESTVNGYDVINTYKTYGFDLGKVDEEGNSLTGAKFTLTKDGETVYFLYDEGTGTYTVCDADTAGATTEIIAGSVHVTGLAEGTYTLTETAAPEGYQASGKYVTIEVGEDGVKWYSWIQSVWNSIISFFGADVDEPVVIADDDGNIEVTNYKLKKISVNKVWDDNNNEYSKRPKNVEVTPDDEDEEISALSVGPEIDEMEGSVDETETEAVLPENTTEVTSEEKSVPEDDAGEEIKALTGGAVSYMKILI